MMNSNWTGYLIMLFNLMKDSVPCFKIESIGSFRYTCQNFLFLLLSLSGVTKLKSSTWAGEQAGCRQPCDSFVHPHRSEQTGLFSLWLHAFFFCSTQWTFNRSSAMDKLKSVLSGEERSRDDGNILEVKLSLNFRLCVLELTLIVKWNLISIDADC